MDYDVALKCRTGDPVFARKSFRVAQSLASGLIMPRPTGDLLSRKGFR
jgi:hypothetical protein